jgi:threonine dehydrogenase-like Zn-dependent dehydrogenase
MGQLWIRGVDIRFAGMANVQAHWRAALDAVRSGKIDPTALVTHRLGLDDAVEGYELFESRAAMKVTLKP